MPSELSKPSSSGAAPNPALQPLKNAKHEAVLQRWIADPARVWWKAYKAVYPKSSQHAAETAASRLLKNAEFVARRDALLRTIAEGVVSSAIMTETQVLEELSKLGRSNVQNALVRGDDTADVVESLEDMPPEVAATIKSLTIDTYTEGKGEDAREVKRLKLELHDKRGPLALLAQHYGLLADKKGGGAAAKGSAPAPIKTDIPLTEAARRIAFALAKAQRAQKQAKG
jgi:phage terminase small subunit